MASELAANTPVLVGVAAVQQKLSDYREALEPIALMEQALRGAADDAGSVELLGSADEILVPKSLWSYTDPGRLLADALGANNARTVLAEFGISQQALLNRACQRIQSGESQVVFVTGGEARYRAQCASRADVEATEVEQLNAQPDEVLLPEDELWSEVEAASGLGMPVGYYAIMDSALRHKQGLSVAEHRDEMAQMYAQFSEIAADNPEAWSDTPVTSSHIREHSAKNRMLAFPYTKLHNSQWTVDQAAGLILCSVQTAQQLGIVRNKWVFPLASTESNFMSVVASRADLGGSAGFRLAGEKLEALAGTRLADVSLCELYSCFPFAVRVQLQELGFDRKSALSVTGGMTFGGGPLNNFVFQATVKMAQLLREQPAEKGLVTTVSGFLTKQALALWSASPPESSWAFADVTAAVRAATDVRELVGDYRGAGTVAGYTVLYQGMDPWRAIAVFDIDAGQRTVAYSEDGDMLSRMQEEECCGEVFQISAGQFQ